MRSFIAALLASAYLVVTPVLAQDTGFYLGAKVGQSKLKGACDPTPGITLTSCDDKDTAWGVFAGYQVNRYFGVETGWTDLGEASASAPVLGFPVNVSVSAKGWELVGVGSIPLSEQFSAYAKAGAYRWRVKGNVAVAGIGSASVSESGTDFTYGLGLRFDFTKSLGARLEWQRYNDLGDENTTGKGDVNLWNLGIVFKF
jgi:OmpA-OmpF porin, OOP family